HVEPERRACLELYQPFREGAHAQLGSLQIEQHRNRPARFALDRANDVEALLVLVLAAVAEVEAEHIRAGIEQRADRGGIRARRAERGDDLGVAITAHDDQRPAMAACRASSLINIARKSLTLVSVGPVTTESPSASKKPWPSLSSRLSLG